MSSLSNLLSLPNELFLWNIFIHFDLTDLIKLFGSIQNRRLKSLVSASLYTRMSIDLARTKVGNQWVMSNLFFIPSGNKIVALRINNNQLNETLAVVLVKAFPKLTHVEVIMLHQRPRQSLFSVLSTMNLHTLTLSSISDDQNEISIYVCNSQCTLRCLTITDDNNPIRTPSAEFLNHYNRHLTCLSIAVVDLGVAASLMCYVPALEKLELRLPQRSRCTVEHPREYRDEDHCSSSQWSTRLRFLSIVAPQPYTRITSSFYDFVRRFASSLERLSFYLMPLFRTMTPQALERELFAQLPLLTRLDFCIHAGLSYPHDNDARHLFDQWAVNQRHVISIYHDLGCFHTRFTLPFVFDRLEMIDTSFLDYHSNLPMADVPLRLPTVRHISFLCSTSKVLTTALLEKIHRTCPRVNSIHFATGGPSLCLSITLANIGPLPSFTYQMITHLKIDHSSTSLQTLRQLFELFPRVEYLVVSHTFLESWRVVQPLCELPKNVCRFTVQVEYNEDRKNIDQWQAWLPSSVEFQCRISEN